MLSLFSARLSPLRHADNEGHLTFFPSQLTIPEVILVILIFVGRQVLHVLGFANQFQINASSGKDEESYELPELTLVMPFKLTESDLEQYVAALKSDDASSGIDSPAGPYNDAKALLESAAQMCIVLSAFTEPAMLLLLAHHKSPIRPLGAVNVRNRFEFLRPDLCSEDVLMKSRCRVLARLVRQARKTKRGLEIDVVVEIMSYEDDPAVVVYRQVFTMLQFMKFKKKLVMPVAKADVLSLDETRECGQSMAFSMSTESPMTWARVCKDYNPIHISALAAKLLGFRSTIAHGNHALAVALGQLETHQDLKIDAKGKAFSMEVQFRKPVILPATLCVSVAQDGGTSCNFYVMQKDKIYVSATLRLVEGK